MGCKNEIFNLEPIVFYKTLDQFSNFSENEREKVKMTLTLKNISDKSDKSEYSISLLLYQDKKYKNPKHISSTEKKIQKNSEIKFDQCFIMEYYFEREQILGFDIKGNDFNETIQTTLGTIMGGKGQKLKKNLKNETILEINGERLNDLKTNINFDISVNGNFTGMAISYLIKYLGNQNNPLNNNIYRSEIVNDKKNITFIKKTIPTVLLAPDEKLDNNIISIELIDNLHNNKLVETNGPISDFISKDQKIKFKGKNEFIIRTKIIKEYCFLDYLRGGMEINLTIGIDFTGSNGSPLYEDSLHYTTQGKLNNYESAIKSCGNILAVYDSDQLFPVYGYGAVLGTQYNLHCFPLNGNNDDPKINTIDNILKIYREQIPKLDFAGPTYFAPLIQKLNNTVKQELIEEHFMNYNILMILTDGQINDMSATIDALVEASFLPISVIIIGIGKGPFGNMDTLDADERPLFDSNGRKANRDLVQFVPFENFKNDGEKLAEQVLEEVPRQVVQYFQYKKIFPKEKQ